VDRNRDFRPGGPQIYTLINMSVTPLSRILPAAIGLAAAGAVVGIAAGKLPVNLRSVRPALLKTAGSGMPTVAALGRDLVDLGRIGPSSLLLAAAKTVNDPRPGVGACD